MFTIKSLISSYELSEELASHKIPPVIFEGAFIYDKSSKEPFVVLDYGNNELKAIPLLTDKVFVKTFKEGEFIKAFTSAEIGELLPADYTLPIKTSEGWAFITEDNDIVTDMFYENETDARVMYLLFFLNHKILTVDDITNQN